MQLRTEHFNYISMPPPPIEDCLPQEGVANNLNLPLNRNQFNSSKESKSFLLASRYAKKNDWRSAIEAYESALGRIPREDKISLAKVHYLIAYCYHELADHEQTLKNFKKAAKLWPDNYDIHLGLGMEYLLSGKSKGAIQTLKAAIRSYLINPKATKIL
jgi:tetratricopeptide (TPR) repeat protein